MSLTLKEDIIHNVISEGDENDRISTSKDVGAGSRGESSGGKSIITKVLNRKGQSETKGSGKWKSLKWVIIGAAKKKELEKRTKVQAVKPNKRGSIFVAFLCSLSSVLIALLLVTLGAYLDGTTITSLFSDSRWEDGVHAVEAIEVLCRNSIGVVEIVLTTTIIVLQMSADKFTGYVASMFFRDFRAMSVNIFLVTTGLYTFIMGFSYNEHEYQTLGPKACLIMSIGTIVIILPYLTYLTMFIDPDEVLTNIVREGINSSLYFTSKKDNSTFIAKLGNYFRTLEIQYFYPNRMSVYKKKQEQTVQSIEKLTQFALHALEKFNIGLCLACCDNLNHLLTEYGNNKSSLYGNSFKIYESTKVSSDFTSLSDEVLLKMESQHIWLEFKALKQIQSIYDKAIDENADVCNRLAMNTRDISEAALLRGDIFVVDIGLKFLNSFLRISLNKCNIRTACTVIHQFSQLTGFMAQRMGYLIKMKSDRRETRKGNHAPVGDHSPISGLILSKSDLEERLKDYSLSYVYYGSLFMSSGMPFVVTVMIHDWTYVCEMSFSSNRNSHDNVLKAFLDLCRMISKLNNPVMSLSAIKQMARMTAFYLTYGAKPAVASVHTVMKLFPTKIIEDAKRDILAQEDQYFWEIADRETNMDFVSPNVVGKVPRIFGFLKST